MPGINDSPRAGRAAARAGRRRGGEQHRRHRPAPARGGARACSWTGCARSARIWSSATSSSTGAAPTRRSGTQAARANGAQRRASRRASCIPARVAATSHREPACARRRPLQQSAVLGSALVGVAGGHLGGDLLRAQAAATRGGGLGGDACEFGAEAQDQRRDVDLGAVALDRAHDARGRRPRASACRRPAGSSISASANMPASRMKPGKHGRDADAAVAQVGAQRRGRSRAGRTWRRCRAACRGVDGLAARARR